MSELCICDNCGARVDHTFRYCPYCTKVLTGKLIGEDRGTFDYYDEPMFYECAMCGMEIVSFEVVRGRKYCYSCAATERHG